jgi:hypothetical protein
MQGVDTEFTEYQPDRAGDGICEHVERSFWQLVVVTVGCGLVAAAALYAYPGRDPLQRWLLEGIVHVFFGLTVATWALQFLQWVSNGNFFKRALQDATSSAIVITGFLYCVTRLVIG